MLFLTLLLAAMMGAVLGALGAGGSLLAVPILVYVAGVAPIPATGGGLVVVGLSALYGAIQHARKLALPWRALTLFAFASLISVAFTRGWLLPQLPDPLWHGDRVSVSLGTALMLMFALLMLASAWRLRHPVQTSARHLSRWRLLMSGALVGGLTGLIGAGGGFLIVPALMLGAGLALPIAIAGSLCCIALNCALGVIFAASHAQLPDLTLLALFTLASWVGMTVGLHYARQLPTASLQRAFAVLLQIVGVAMLFIELRRLYV